ncbi:hypothetical protein AQI95_09880 [Streptomyces yokosukanensis]|uniref:Uncharacterized protein n=1 Tax=Streptomyces yokosukanensis TaxID=67386 RepID=A0A101PB32_9ACTN|nr:hypothetical protein [Streptomyces yokosukanensis]KUN08208.1 hypothetical protein AQI95_09880 [Streptomyces yokosukanensis]
MHVNKHLAAVAATVTLLCGGLVSAPSAAAATHPAVSAASSGVWCGAWDPNPANTTNKRLVAGSQNTNPDGSWVGLYEGEYRGTTYMWAYLGNAHVGATVDLAWQYRGNGVMYTCGDASGSDHATVWSGTNQTWTSGVPVSSVKDYLIEQ